MSKEFKGKDKNEFKKGGKDNNRKKSYKPKKGKDRSETPNGEESLKGNINDASYYFSNPELLSQVTNVSFNEYLGVPVDLTAEPSIPMVEKVANVSAFYMNPSVQPTGYEDSARYASINVIGFKNYLLLSANNAKTTSYAPQDVTCLILAIGQVLAMYSFLRRPFGCIYLINQRNRSYPELIFKAMGIDYSDFKANVADYRIKLNQLIAMFDRIPFFSEVPYFDKCIKMFDYIYVDEDSPLAQSYLFVPQTTWTIDEAYDPNGTGLVTTPVVNKGTSKTFEEYLGIFSDMINALATSSTFNSIFSDVLRVVSNGKGKTLTLEVISEAYAVTPVINEEIRHWINNARFLHLPDDKDAFPGDLGIGATNYNDVSSKAEINGILYNPIFSIFGSDHNAVPVTKADAGRWLACAATYQRDLVNFDSMSPSVEDKISATRLSVRGNYLRTEAPDKTKEFYTLQNVGLGDYYCTGMLVYDNVVDAPLVVNTNSLSDNTERTYDTIIVFDKLDKLKYAPRTNVTYGVASSGNYLKAISGDLCYYTTLDFYYMKRLKDVESLTIFAINV